jgi:hypothetical protein
MSYKTISENRFIVATPQELFKVFKALCREGLYLPFIVYFWRNLKIMSLPDHIINVARQLDREQMLALQLSLRAISEEDRLSRFKLIEEILGDYGLPTDGLSQRQIIGFANFVNSL